MHTTACAQHTTHCTHLADRPLRDLLRRGWDDQRGRLGLRQVVQVLRVLAKLEDDTALGHVVCDVRRRDELPIPVGGVGPRLLHCLVQLLGEAELVAGVELLARCLRALHELLSEAELVAGRVRALLHEQPGARTVLARIADSGTGRSDERMARAGQRRRESERHGRDEREGAEVGHRRLCPLHLPRVWPYEHIFTKFCI